MLEAGMIILWSGIIATIPDGWVLCDGNNGTPDLRDRFIIGAGDTYDPGDTGGNTQHSHMFISDAHDHVLQAGNQFESGIVWDDTTTAEVVTGETTNAFNLPLFHSLAFIMKT